MSTYYYSLQGDSGNNPLTATYYLVPDPIDFIQFDYYVYNQVYGLAGNDTITANLGSFSLTAVGGLGDDDITGTDLGDLLIGDNRDAVSQQLSGSGKDTVHGGAGSDIVMGVGGRDMLYGDAGNDYLYGGGGNDIIRGADDADSVFGGPGDDKLFGGPGNDTLAGGLDNDVLIGGLGSDTFSFTGHVGHDRIKDFDAQSIDHDLIVLDQTSDITGFKDLMKYHAEAAHGDVILSLDGGDTVTIENTKPSELIAGDFVFLHS